MHASPANRRFSRTPTEAHGRSKFGAARWLERSRLLVEADKGTNGNVVVKTDLGSHFGW